jgi:hypothetical protein
LKNAKAAPEWDGRSRVGTDQLKPPNSQITKMIGSGMPIIQRRKPRPIVQPPQLGFVAV